MKNKKIPVRAKFGLGLRSKHYEYIFTNKPKVDFFEIISENFMESGGRPKANLAKIKELYPLVMHGVSLSIGTVDPLNSQYLKKLKKLIKLVNPIWISDHLCWTGVAHKNTHDLLPLPYTKDSMRHVVNRIKEVQDYLEMPLALENPSTYLEFKHSKIPEAEFIAVMAERSGCNLLLDVNNVYVTCYNHGLDPKKYIDSLPLDKVIQVHLSGHKNKGNHIVDTHDDFVVDEVWNLYKYFVYKAGRIPNTMIEWDDNIPEFSVLFDELNKAKVAANDSANYILPNIYLNNLEEKSKKKIHLKDSQKLMQKSIILGKNFDSKVKEWVFDKEKFSAQDQLNVYVDAYRYRLNDATAEDYPALKNYLGEKKFNELIWDFVNNEKPNHFNIAKYTLKLQKFLEKKYPKDIFSHELCCLETIIAKLHEPEETAPLEQKHLKNMTVEKLMRSKLYPRKALKLIELSYLVNKYYQEVMNEKKSKPVKGESFLVIFRHENSVWRMDLEKEEFTLLQDLFSKMKVSEALENKKLSPEMISKYFSKWINNGLFAVHNY